VKYVMDCSKGTVEVKYISIYQQSRTTSASDRNGITFVMYEFSVRCCRVNIVGGSDEEFPCEARR
jgi:hypothetical protein